MNEDERVVIYLTRFKNDTDLICSFWTKQEAEASIINHCSYHPEVSFEDYEIVEIKMPSMKLAFERLLGDVSTTWDVYSNNPIVPPSQIPESYKFIVMVLSLPYWSDIVAESFHVLSENPKMVMNVMGVPVLHKELIG